MSKFALTIGMATYDDYDGVYFTVQSLRSQLLLLGLQNQVEIIVVDNNPSGAHGPHCKRLMENHRGPFAMRYIAFPDAVGTTQSRERIFAEANGEVVVCMDCHVLMAHPASWKAILDFYTTNPDSKDMLCGPLLNDAFGILGTHFAPVWRSEMWGIWAQAWATPDGHSFTVLERQKTDGSVVAEPNHLMGKGKVKISCLEGVTIPWPGHQAKLTELGCVPLGVKDSDMFEVPGQGLGFFVCRKAAWPGFNPHFRAFGGEELYIHEKVRRNGGRVLCLGVLKWIHRFGRVYTVPYPLTLEDKVRNYVLGHLELEMSADPVYRHFVEEIGIPKQLWEQIIRDPINYQSPGKKGCTVKANKHPDLNAPSGLPQPPAGQTLEELYDWTRNQKRDLDQHLPQLKILSQQCKSVTEITKRRESSIALLAGRPERVLSFQMEQDPFLGRIRHSLAKDGETPAWSNFAIDNFKVPKIPPTDMLFVDAIHTEQYTREVLTTHAGSVSHFIVFHDTHTYGVRGEDGGPGILIGIREWIKSNPEWFVFYHTAQQHGLTVLSRDNSERPAVPVMPWPIGYGPGTELRKFFKSFGIQATPTCSCNARAEQMDKLGADWCEKNLDIIVGWLREEFEKQSKQRALAQQQGMKVQPYPWLLRIVGFQEILARRAVKIAIHRARRLKGKKSNV